MFTFLGGGGPQPRIRSIPRWGAAQRTFFTARGPLRSALFWRLPGRAPKVRAGCHSAGTPSRAVPGAPEGGSRRPGHHLHPACAPLRCVAGAHLQGAPQTSPGSACPCGSERQDRPAPAGAAGRGKQRIRAEPQVEIRAGRLPRQVKKAGKVSHSVTRWCI